MEPAKEVSRTRLSLSTETMRPDDWSPFERKTVSAVCDEAALEADCRMTIRARPTRRAARLQAINNSFTRMELSDIFPVSRCLRRAEEVPPMWGAHPVLCRSK